jgi:hypothetical protein
VWFLVLVWQLEVEVNLDTLGWAKNCLSLVDYFTKLKHDYQAVRALQHFLTRSILMQSFD